MGAGDILGFLLGVLACHAARADVDVGVHGAVVWVVAAGAAPEGLAALAGEDNVLVVLVPGQELRQWDAVRAGRRYTGVQ